MSNTFNVCRSVWTDPQFPKEEFSKREAWLWMISEASWKPRQKRVGNIIVQLERGQFAAGVRGLAKIWGWRKTKVERFLELLTQHKNIRTDSGTGVTRITICNYDRFQSSPNDSGTPSGTESGHYRDTTGTILNKDEIPDETPELSGELPLTDPSKPNKQTESDLKPPQKPKYTPDFETFWSNFPKRDDNGSKDRTFKRWKSIIKGGVTAETLLKAGQAYANARSGQDAQYTKKAINWLGDCGWEQFQSQPSSKPPDEQITLKNGRRISRPFAVKRCAEYFERKAAGLMNGRLWERIAQVDDEYPPDHRESVYPDEIVRVAKSIARS